MADTQISALTDGGAFQAGDFFVVARAGANNKIAGSKFPLKLYDYTVAGVDKASIDTNVDGTLAGLLSGAFSLLEILIFARTDEAVALSAINMTVNNDTTSIYDRVTLTNTNTTVTGANALASAAWAIAVAGASAAAGVFGVYRISIPNYAGTVANKFGEITGGVADTTAANTRLLAGTLGYRSTTALSRFAFTPTTGGQKFKIGSRILIYAYP